LIFFNGFAPYLRAIFGTFIEVTEDMSMYRNNLMKYGFVLNLVLLFIKCVAIADTIDPLRDPEKLNIPKAGGKSAMMRDAVKLKTAKVLIKDVPLINKDFPETIGMSDPDLDKWLIQHTAYIDESQIQQGEGRNINSKMQLKQQDRVKAYRPDQYGRAMVFEVKDKDGSRSGLIDVKGVGANAPAVGDHKHGLASLDEAMREYAMEKLVSGALEHSGSGIKTVGTYAVIDPGFDVNLADKETHASLFVPAGLILRQAHERSSTKGTALPVEDALVREKILRPYGITSSRTASKLNPTKNRNGETMNLQGTKQGDIVDFGAFVIVGDFPAPLIRCKAEPQNILLHPREIQPNVHLLPRRADIWGYIPIIDSSEETPKVVGWQESLGKWTALLARDYRSGTIRKEFPQQLIHSWIQDVKDQWSMGCSLDADPSAGESVILPQAVSSRPLLSEPLRSDLDVNTPVDVKNSSTSRIAK
jgi:hypothetical protein